MTMDDERISLADAISALRNQIRAAAIRAQALPEAQRFRITEAELELTDLGNVEVGSSLTTS